MRRVFVALVLLAGAAGFATASPGRGAEREPLDIDLLARVPSPGQPEPIAIGPDGLVYVATNQLGHGDTEARSKVFVYTPGGRLVREYVVRGQNLAESHGIQGLVFDRSGLLYLLDRAERARVIVLNPITGRQRDYSIFPDVPKCIVGEPGACSATTISDAAAEPDYAVFAPDGSLYVTDIEQALIFRVPTGGGDAEVWFTDQRLESPYGANGIQLMADRRTLLFAVTSSADLTRGGIYRLPIMPDGTAGELTPFWTSAPLETPDGIAIARSGNVYVALVIPSQILVLSPEGEELARAPESLAENSALEVPVDGPGSLAFLGRRVLVTNHSGLFGNEESWAILDVFAGERGLPLHYPLVAPRQRRPRLDLSASPDEVPVDEKRRYRFKVTVGRGPRSYPAAGARIHAGGRVVRTDRRGRAQLTLRLEEPGGHPVLVRRRGLRPGRTVIRAAPIRGRGR